MNFNLNKKKITKNALLSYIKDIDVYNFYSGKEIELNKTINSPLRDDPTPSFGYFVGETNEICFNDFVLGAGDFIRFVEILLSLSFFEALSQIATDFNLCNHFDCKIMKKFNSQFVKIKEINRDKLIKDAIPTKLGVRTRQWKFHDALYWEQFGITKKILEKYNVFPIDYIFINSNPILADKYAYVFYEFKDNIKTTKIYQPFNSKHKWLNNHNESVWQGWEQLPEKGEQLIITKSLKDVMSIVSILNIPSVALNSESIRPKQHILDELNERFKLKFLLYDNDFDKETNIGKIMGERIVENQPIIQIEIPDEFKCKDFSDLIKKYGQNKAKEIYRTRIEMPF